MAAACSSIRSATVRRPTTSRVANGHNRVPAARDLKVADAGLKPTGPSRSSGRPLGATPGADMGLLPRYAPSTTCGRRDSYTVNDHEDRAEIVRRRWWSALPGRLPAPGHRALAEEWFDGKLITALHNSSTGVTEASTRRLRPRQKYPVRIGLTTSTGRQNRSLLHS